MGQHQTSKTTRGDKPTTYGPQYERKQNAATTNTENDAIVHQENNTSNEPDDKEDIPSGNIWRINTPTKPKKMSAIKTINSTKRKLADMMSETNNNKDGEQYEMALIDNCADTVGMGGTSWIIDSLTERTVTVVGYDKDTTATSDLKVGSGMTATDLPDGETIILEAHESVIMSESGTTLMSVEQMRNHGVIVEDKPHQHGGMANIQVEGYVIPIIQTEGLPAIKIRKPTEKELEECIHVEITRDEPWSPHDINEDDITEEQYNNLLDSLAERETRGAVGSNPPAALFLTSL